MNRKWLSLIGSVLLLGAIGIYVFCIHKSNQTDADVQAEQKEETILVGVDTLRFERISKMEIGLFWSDEQDVFVDTYIIKKRPVIESMGTGEWQTIDTIKSDGTVDGKEWSLTDVLNEESPQQFEYRVDVSLAITEAIEEISETFIEEQFLEDGTVEGNTVIFEPAEGTKILASNVKICIDPGHFHKPGEVTEADEYAYIEGDFMLEVALELRERLRKQYGIDACLTRDSDEIALGGYRNEELDSAHISLRGEYAKEEDCDLFISLHTNSNEEGANGYETFFQPMAINKPIIILNTYGLDLEPAIKAANAIGSKLASVNFELGLSDRDTFDKVTRENIREWSKEYNDALGEVGTVVIRTGKKNPDYYGILRGATNVEVPGMIIEHGYHSVAEVRKAAAIGDLKEVWANADACGIAYGFGFTK